MSKSASEVLIRDLQRQLSKEKNEHARTRNHLQAEITRWQRLAGRPVRGISMLELFGVYPALRKLIHVLFEAAELQDPSRSAPSEDTARVSFVHSGENASSSHAELGYATHQVHRANVRALDKGLSRIANKFDNELRTEVHYLAKLVAGEEWEYGIPERPVCWVKDCRKRGVKQAYAAWVQGCAGCGRLFGKEMVG
jgi:hypothetical protein